MNTALSKCAAHPEWNTGLAQWQNAFKLNRLSHAILIAQEQGASLQDFGWLCAKALLCANPQLGLSCDACQYCAWFEAGTHPDYYQLGEMHTGTTIDAVRTLIAALDQTAHQSGRQVVLLEGVDLFSPPVGNALLKTLEEPTGNVVFLLLAKRRHQVLQTIRSRCLNIQLAHLDETVSENHLNAQKIFFNPNDEAFLPAALQDWAVEQPQEALIVFYNVIKGLLEKNLVEDPGVKAHKKALLQRVFALMAALCEAQKQCQLPGINKLMLIESLFYRWQALRAEWG